MQADWMDGGSRQQEMLKKIKAEISVAPGIVEVDENPDYRAKQLNKSMPRTHPH